MHQVYSNKKPLTNPVQAMEMVQVTPLRRTLASSP